MNCACGKMCKLLIMNEHDLLHENFSVNCNHCHWIAVTLLASVICCKLTASLQRNTTSMAGVCNAQFSYVGLNIFLVVIFVLANQDGVPGTVVETQISK